MHQYLDAIGFKNTFFREADIERMLDNLFQSFDDRQAAREEIPGCAFLEMSKSYGPGIGIRLCGQMDSQGFHRMFYYPYLEKKTISVEEYVTVDVRANGEGYVGMVDCETPGMSILFHLQNPARFKKVSFRQILSHTKVPVSFTGLSTDGMILLGHRPLKETEKKLRSDDDKERARLISDAGRGNQDAAVSLTMEDMETFAMLSRRIVNEDIYTIVESSFMPSGMECDHYKVIGTILFYTKVRNTLTRQYMYQLTVDCNGIPVDICINEQDLLGDPEVGRRFKGSIWLQGMLLLDEPQAEAAQEKSAAQSSQM